ncbi:TetR/AcrR family transcriptional regulator [uncultured Agitococcus sp.]|uniref:TetR/AcrR family transcriptional regulator n=1 Tax=uncultured Agitococcus sp. TaxID=1506599 RepID=UPI0026348DA0|nr:TetR/AcrR family transcriptional regulator [uncultured Agitococcus sp.]
MLVKVPQQVKALEKIPSFGCLDDSPRGRVLRAAAHLFRVNGYEGTTVREIASLVGIQSGSLFHHFKSKEEILFTVMKEVIEYTSTKQNDAIAQVSSYREKLKALIISELYAINGVTCDAMTVLVFEWNALSRTHQHDLLELRTAYEDTWVGILQHLKKETGYVQSAHVWRKFLVGSIAWTVTWFKKDGSLSLEDLAEQLLLMALGKNL